ncbi:MAG: formate dehydrogenase-N subunit alpha, partial [candidate division WOR-3 bacterium]
MELSRRDFLKISAITAGSLLLPVGEALAKEDQKYFPLHKPLGEGKTVCPYCSCGCGVLVATDKDGHIINSEGDPENPINRGALDPKSISVRQLSTSPKRLGKVLYRAPNSDKWEEKSWEWAIAEISKRIKKVRDETFVKTINKDGKDIMVNRTEGLAWLGGAANNSEDCYLATKFCRSLGMVFVEHQARVCHSSTVAGLGPSFGRGAMTNDWIDIKNADVIMIIGGNPAENHPATFTWINKAREHGAKLIVVDPRFTRSAATAEIYAPIRPGTDIAFVGGLINYTIQNKLYQEEYVKYYTNALTLVNPEYKGPAELDGYFSGYDAEKRTYNNKTWQYQMAGNFPKRATNLDDPHCVFAILKKHYSRYTPEMVEKVCGTPKEKFLDVARTFCATGKPDKSATILYAMGTTQHTVGSQYIRSYAMLQLLLGNIGVPGGGINAARGESNVQGSTDMAVLFHLLPGYLGAPKDTEPDLETYNKKFDKTCFWVHGPKFFNCLMKAWFGDAANPGNQFAYNYLPKASGNYSFISIFEAMYAKKIRGLICMGMNPAVSGPNGRFERKAMENLDWLVAMDLFETETASFWKAPGVNSKDIKTEVFLLPAADAMEKAGSIVTSGRRIQWRPKVAQAPGESKEDIWILTQLMKTLKELYKGSSDPKDRPILDLIWDYGDPPNVELVAREINGYALEDIFDKKDEKKILAEKGKIISSFGVIANAKNPDKIACGTWIYGGYMAPMDDGTGVVMPACKRRGQKDPGNLGMFPFWGFAWPANRHILYNRASAKPDGTPWAENKKLIWWDATQKKWVGF